MEANTADTAEPVRFGRYIALRTIGEGAMGKVYLAEDPVLQRQLAVKVITVDRHVDEKTREEYLQRFTIEARASAKLNHPSIVTIHDAGEENGFPWIAFEYVKGDPLDEKIKREGMLSFGDISAITLSVSSALDHAHKNHIIHRDIKPANILIDKRTSIAKLADFGVVKSPWSGLTQEGNVVGSPGYMSPEQIEGFDIDGRSDLFSLGIVLYQMVTGKNPFVRETIPATMFATLNCSYVSPRQIRPDTPDAVITAISRLLLPDPEQRLKSAEELMAIMQGQQPVAVFTPVSAMHPGTDIAGASRAGSKENAALTPASEAMTSVAQTAMHLRAAAAHGYKFASVCARTVVKHRFWPELYKRANVAILTVVRYFKDGHFGRHAGITMRFISRCYFSARSAILQHPRISLWTAATVAGIVCICSLVNFAVSYSDTGNRAVLKELAGRGYKGTPRQLIDTCDFLIRSGRFNDASDLAEGIAKLHGFSAQGYVLLGRSEIRDEDYDKARDAFIKAEHVTKGKSVISNDREKILDDFEYRLGKDEIEDGGVDLIVNKLQIAGDKRIRKWTEDKNDVLRWNGVRVLEAAKIKVDMVEVYTIDLKYGNGMRTRVRAAEMLGELGDKRAIPALEEASQRFFRDPFTAATASSALEKMKAKQ